MAKATYSNVVKQAFIIALSIFVLVVILLVSDISSLYKYVTAKPLGPYAEINQPVLESAKPGDLIVCGIENPVPPTTENVSKLGLVLHNINIQSRSLGIILFDRMYRPPIYISGGVMYSSFNNCKVSIVKDRAKQAKIIGEAVLNASEEYLEQ